MQHVDRYGIGKVVCLPTVCRVHPILTFDSIDGFKAYFASRVACLWPLCRICLGYFRLRVLILFCFWSVMLQWPQILMRLQVCEMALDHMGKRTLHLSFDIDSCDPGASDTGWYTYMVIAVYASCVSLHFDWVVWHWCVWFWLLNVVMAVYVCVRWCVLMWVDRCGHGCVCLYFTSTRATLTYLSLVDISVYASIVSHLE